MYRRQRQGSLEVDGDDVMDGTSPGALQQLNVNNQLFLGTAYLLTAISMGQAQTPSRLVTFLSAY